MIQAIIHIYKQISCFRDAAGKNLAEKGKEAECQTRCTHETWQRRRIIVRQTDPVYVKQRGGAINKIITEASGNCILGSVNVWMKFRGVSCHKVSQMLEGMSDGAILWRDCTKWQLFHKLVGYLSQCKVPDHPNKRPISSVNFQHLSLIQPARTDTACFCSLTRLNWGLKPTLSRFTGCKWQL